MFTLFTPRHEESLEGPALFVLFTLSPEGRHEGSFEGFRAQPECALLNDGPRRLGVRHHTTVEQFFPSDSAIPFGITLIRKMRPQLAWNEIDAT